MTSILRSASHLALRAGALGASAGAAVLKETARRLQDASERAAVPEARAAVETPVAVEHRDEPRPARVESGTARTAPAHGRISNPKAARKVRKRTQAAARE